MNFGERWGIGPHGLFLCAVSYCWCSVSHPDSDCFHLDRLATILSIYSEVRQREKSFPDLAVFWDFISIHQAERSAVEKAFFRASLKGMQLVYGHDLSLVLKMTAMPPCPHELDESGRFEAIVKGETVSLAWEYPQRGWPTFESAVADTRTAVFSSRLCFGHDLSDMIAERDTFGAVFSQKYTSQGLAVHPARLAKKLDARSFTNGSDREDVKDLYAKTFAVLKHTKLQNLQFLKWSEAMVHEYMEAFYEFEYLENFHLSDCDIDLDRYMHLFAKALKEKPRLQLIMMQGVKMTDKGWKDFCLHLPPNLKFLSVDSNGPQLKGQMSITDAGADMITQGLLKLRAFAVDGQRMDKGRLYLRGFQFSANAKSKVIKSFGHLKICVVD